MKIVLVSDAWQPQVHGMVTALVERVLHLVFARHEVQVIQPGQFRTRPCPGFAHISLALLPGREMERLPDQASPDAIHIAIEGPLDWAAHPHCLRRRWPLSGNSRLIATAALTGLSRNRHATVE